MKVLLTGCAGFIGSHTWDRLLAEGDEVLARRGDCGECPLGAKGTTTWRSAPDLGGHRQGKKLLGYEPTTNFKEGVRQFYDWWKRA